MPRDLNLPKYGNRPESAALYDRDLDALADVLYLKMHRAIDDSELVRSCINCHFFVESTEICTQYGNARPPARIIARGCQGHSKAIPF